MHTSRPSISLGGRSAVGHAVSLAFGLSLVTAGCRDPAPVPALAGAEQPVPLVEAVPARSGALPIEERVSGIARALNQVVIRPEIEATIVEVLVRSGDRVARGQPLVRLEPRSVRDSVRQADATARLAEATTAAARARVTELEAQVVRTRQLAAQAVASQLERETQEAQLAAAQATVGQAVARVDEARAAASLRRTVLSKTIVRAPIAGRIGRRNAELGMLVNPATVLFVVGDLDKLVIDVPLTERLIGKVVEGQPARISAASLGRDPVDARLSRISPFLATGSFSTTGEIDVENRDGRLNPGMFVTVDILLGESARATLLPLSALWEDPRSGALSVFVVPAHPADRPAGDPPPGPFQRRTVEVLATGRSTVGVRGVNEGEWVVTIGQHLLAREGTSAARVRLTSWDHVLGLQTLQQEHLLARFLEKQQRLARTQGARPPSSDSFIQGGTAIP